MRRLITMSETIMETLGIAYEEKEDGLLYPVLDYGEDEKISVGKYGGLWICYMQDNHNYRYRELVRVGRLRATAAQVNEEAYRMLDSIMGKYLDTHKPDNPHSTMEMWKLREQAQRQAEEIVLASVVYSRY
jgi:hypothetical protein